LDHVKTFLKFDISGISCLYKPIVRSEGIDRLMVIWLNIFWLANLALKLGLKRPQIILGYSDCFETCCGGLSKQYCLRGPIT